MFFFPPKNRHILFFLIWFETYGMRSDVFFGNECGIRWFMSSLQTDFGKDYLPLRVLFGGGMEILFAGGKKEHEIMLPVHSSPPILQDLIFELRDKLLTARLEMFLSSDKNIL